MSSRPAGCATQLSEYMHLDNSACNLASLNLLTFLNDDDSFDVDGFKAAVEVVFTAQEILVGNADYPTPKIAENTRKFRQLGLGYANWGSSWPHRQCPTARRRIHLGPGPGGRYQRCRHRPAMPRVPVSRALMGRVAPVNAGTARSALMEYACTGARSTRSMTDELFPSAAIRTWPPRTRTG